MQPPPPRAPTSPVPVLRATTRWRPHLLATRTHTLPPATTRRRPPWPTRYARPGSPGGSPVPVHVEPCTLQQSRLWLPSVVLMEMWVLIRFCLQASPSPSPVGYSPMTPGAPSPGGYNPHTPGSNIEQGSSDWVTTDILVRVKDSFMDLMGQTGVIRSVTVKQA